MKRPSQKKSDDRTHEIVAFMTEFARFLLAAGISRNKFSKLVEFSFFRAASSHARFQNKRLNQSAVAAMTGLTRSQVREMLKRAPGDVATSNDRLDRIIGAWTSDAEYITVTNAPRRLRIDGVSPSFFSLVRKVGGDIPPRSVLREMQRQRLVVVKDRYVKLSEFAKNDNDSRSLRQLSNALARVIQLTGNDEQQVSVGRAVTMEVSYPALSGAGKILMQRRLSKILRTFLIDLEAAGNAVALESPSKRRGGSKRVSQTRLLLLTREQDIS